ncbi:MAG: transcriptional repressor [Chloroflexota bacterium]|nr:transcriptional repressor [Chloroflexota bacterium]
MSAITRDAKSDFRMTPQRAAILEAVQGADAHLTAGEIFERVHARYPSIAYGTVYRTLHLFAERGLILEFPFGDEASRFDKRTDRHDHVRCNACGKLVDVDVPEVLFARQVASEQTGFRIVGHQTVFSGTCPACQRLGDRVR